MTDGRRASRAKSGGGNAAPGSGRSALPRTGHGKPRGNRRASGDRGEDPFFFRIADVTVALLRGDSDLNIGIDPNIEGFLVEEADPDVRIRAKWGDLSGKNPGEMIFDSGSLWQLYRENQTHLFRFTSPVLGSTPYKIASFNRDFTRGEVCLHRPCFPPGQPLCPLEYPLDELLFVNLLAQKRGLEVHACGIIDSLGNGRLFLGQSGAGKTTMARIWQNEEASEILSDDRIILRKVNGSLWIYGTPWHGEAKLASPSRAPLKEVLFLEHGSGNERISMGKAEAVARLISCSFVPLFSADGMEFSLRFCDEVVKSVPCGRLRFVPDSRVMKLIKGDEGP